MHTKYDTLIADKILHKYRTFWWYSIPHILVVLFIFLITFTHRLHLNSVISASTIITMWYKWSLSAPYCSDWQPTLSLEVGVEELLPVARVVAEWRVHLVHLVEAHSHVLAIPQDVDYLQSRDSLWPCTFGTTNNQACWYIEGDLMSNKFYRRWNQNSYDWTFHLPVLLSLLLWKFSWTS